MLKENGETLGGMAGFIYQVAFVRLMYLSLPYGGVVGESPPADELSAMLRGYAREKGVARIHIAMSPGMPDPLAGAPTSAFRSIEMATHMLPFEGRDADQQWNAFKGGVRRNIRKAEKSQLEVTAAKSATEARTFYDMYVESMRRNNTVAKYPAAFVDEIFRTIIERDDRGVLLLAMHEGNTVAGMLLVDSQRMSHYLMGGSQTEALHLRPNDLLFWHAIRRSIERGHDAFDFLPSGPDDDNLDRFKGKWGSSRVEIPVYEIITSKARMKLFSIAYKAAESSVGRKVVNAMRKRGKGGRA